MNLLRKRLSDIINECILGSQVEKGNKAIAFNVLL